MPVVVSFPPLPGASSSLRHVDLEGWKPSGGNTSAVDTTEPWLPLLESRRYDPAAAAVEEWPGTLRELFGEGLKLEATTHNRATVWAPLSLLPGVLDWVAEQPLVHWVAPRYKHHFKNYYATAITSNGSKAPIVLRTRFSSLSMLTCSALGRP